MIYYILCSGPETTTPDRRTRSSQISVFQLCQYLHSNKYTGPSGNMAVRNLESVSLSFRLSTRFLKTLLFPFTENYRKDSIQKSRETWLSSEQLQLTVQRTIYYELVMSHVIFRFKNKKITSNGFAHSFKVI